MRAKVNVKVIWTAGVVGRASGGERRARRRRRRRGQRYKHQRVVAAEPWHDPRPAWADVRLRQFLAEGRGSTRAAENNAHTRTHARTHRRQMLHLRSTLLVLVVRGHSDGYICIYRGWVRYSVE